MNEANGAIELGGFGGMVTTAQAAALFGVSQTAIQMRVSRYHLPVYRIAGRMLMRLSDLQASYSRNVHGVLDGVQDMKGGA